MDGLVLDKILYYLTEPESVFWTDHDTAEVAHNLGLVSKTSWISDLSQMIWKKLYKKYIDAPKITEKEIFWYYTRPKLDYFARFFRIDLKPTYSRNICLSMVEEHCRRFHIPLDMRPKIVGQTKIFQIRAVRDFKLSQNDLEQFEPEVIKNPHYRSRCAYLYNTRDIRKFARYKQYCNQVATRLKHKTIKFVLAHESCDPISGKITAYRDFKYRVLVSRKKQSSKLEAIKELKLEDWVSTTIQVEQESFTGKYCLRSISNTEYVVFEIRLDLK